MTIDARQPWERSNPPIDASLATLDDHSLSSLKPLGDPLAPLEQENDTGATKMSFLQH